MSKKLSSNVWIYFQINALDNSKATCKICCTSVSRGGKEPKHWTTSNLMSHVRNRHVVEYARLQQERTSTSSINVSSASPSTAASPSIGSTSGNSGYSPQQSLADVLDR